MSKKILIADDEKKMLIMLQDFLKRDQFEVISVSNGLEAYEAFLQDPTIDLVILDIMMPVMDGIEACAKIRETSDIPIIMLTAKTREVDELLGFHKGADEYIKKPFSPSVLVARVKALLKRTTKKQDTYNNGILNIDFINHIVKVDTNSIKLSKIEFKLLEYFIDNENSVLNRDQILNAVWGFDYVGTDRTVDTTINRLRIKLLEADTYIQTIHGFGYKFEVIE